MGAPRPALTICRVSYIIHAERGLESLHVACAHLRVRACMLCVRVYMCGRICVRLSALAHACGRGYREDTFQRTKEDTLV